MNLQALSINPYRQNGQAVAICITLHFTCKAYFLARVDMNVKAKMICLSFATTLIVFGTVTHSSGHGSAFLKGGVIPYQASRRPGTETGSSLKSSCK